MTNLFAHMRRSAIPYLALLLVLAVGLGGGYALAASKSKTITVCADKTTGILHLKAHGQCKRSQTRVTWNQQGPAGAQGSQGPQGATGAQGPQGAPGSPAVSVWADVANNGVVVAGQGLSVQHVSTGTYQVTVTDAACSGEINAPVVSVSDVAPGMRSPGEFPAAWYEAGVNQFTVFTGDVTTTSGFASADHTFDILDTCP
jgi:hypothetical protein